MLYLIAYIATIPLANWLVVHVGVIPVGFGLAAPAGVLVVGLSLVLRDMVQRSVGVTAGLLAIVLGAAISALLAPPALVAASTVAFLFSEFADFAIYTPLQRRGFIRAVIASSLVGLVVDSALFLWLAFGDLTYLWGQIVGKTEMVAASALVLAVLRSRRLPTLPRRELFR